MQISDLHPHTTGRFVTLQAYPHIPAGTFESMISKETGDMLVTERRVYLSAYPKAQRTSATTYAPGLQVPAPLKWIA